MGSYRPHPRGFGFVSFEERTVTGVTLDSAFVPPPKATDFIAGDQVTVRVDVDADGRGTVARAKLLARTRTHVCGTVNRVHGRLVLTPDPHVATAAIALAGPAVKDLTVGQVALVELSARPDGPARVVTTWPGHTPEAVRAWMFSRHNLEMGRAADVDTEASALSDAALGRLAAAPAAGRADLRDLVTFTIDGAASRDLDDAISVAAVKGGWRVWVHIADVAGTVPAGSIVDCDAAAYATSVYLPGWNRPMLPPTLSENALSLLPGTDRDTLTVAYTVTRTGQVRDVEMTRSRIHSDARLTYTGSSAALDEGNAAGMPKRVFAALKLADAAAAALGIERSSRLPLGERVRASAPYTVTVKTGNDADPYTGAAFETVKATNPVRTELLIERLMVAANEAVASWLVARELPGVFRTHAEPGADLAEDVHAIVGYLPKALRAPLAAAATPVHLLGDLEQRLVTAGHEAAVVDMLLMRHLERATYTDTVGAHHGLGSAGYVHFTSPIRRYADLLVHRVVLAHLDNDTAAVSALAAELPQLCEHVTAASGVAARIEGQFRRFVTTLLLPADLGPVTGVVTGFTAKGAFVDLPDHGVSGLLSFRDLAGRWDADDRLVAAIEAGTGNVLRLGDEIRVTVADRDPVAGQMTVAKVSRPARRSHRPRRTA